MSIRVKRGTRSQIDAAAAANTLVLAEVMYANDQNTVLVATSTNAASPVLGGVAERYVVGDLATFVYVPEGNSYLLAAGQNLSQSVYPELFAAIGHRYYAGDRTLAQVGTNTFFSASVTNDTDFSPDGLYLARAGTYGVGLSLIQGNSSPQNVALVLANGFGQCQTVRWSRDGKRFVVASTTGTNVRIYSTENLNTFTQFVGGNAAKDVCWSPNGQYIALAHTNTPYVSIYDTLAVFANGAPLKIPNPSTLPTTNAAASATGVDWSPNGQYLAVAHSNTPFVTIYNWANGLPIKIGNPAALPTGNATGAAWSPNNRYLAVSHLQSPFVTIYDWANGSPVKITNPANLPVGNSFSVGWSADGRYLAVGHVTTPFYTVYDWANGTPVRIANVASDISSTVNSVSFSPDSRYLVLTSTTRAHMFDTIPSTNGFYVPNLPQTSSVKTYIKVS